MRGSAGGRIARVLPDSVADATGLQAGDSLLSINGHALHDIIDYRFYAAEETLEIVIRTRSGELQTRHIQRDYGQDLGMEFGKPTFDGIRRCRNRCDFCFIHQMPPGLRKSLYVKDDDYRYSFLFGNFVTLTNFEEADWERLAEQRLSPLYVSVHSTDPALRGQLLGLQHSSAIVSHLKRLGGLGIKVHTQIVIVPGVNDGDALQRTVHDLAGLHPTVSSIALVPVGLTRYHDCGMQTVSPQEAKTVLRFARPLCRAYRDRFGIGLLYPSDEFYLLARARIPSARNYDGFSQLANGVGLVRQLLDDWGHVRKRLPPAGWPACQVTLVCGKLIAPTLTALVSELAQRVGANLQVVPVTNRFFGPTVTVSGLLTGQDVVTELGRHNGANQVVVLPRAMFDASGEVTLDDYRVSDIAEELGVPVRLANRLGEVWPPTQSELG